MNRHGSSFGSNNCSKRVVFSVSIHFLCCGFGRVLRSASTGDALFFGVPQSPVFFINLNSSESYLIIFFATQIVPYDLLYYNNGIEIRVNDTIFSIFTWVLSYFILVLLIVISTIMYRFF